MVKTGINKYSGRVNCYINDERAVKIAKKDEITRAAAAIRVAVEEGFNGPCCGWKCTNSTFRSS